MRFFFFYKNLCNSRAAQTIRLQYNNFQSRPWHILCEKQKIVYSPQLFIIVVGLGWSVGRACRVDDTTTIILYKVAYITFIREDSPASITTSPLREPHYNLLSRTYRSKHFTRTAGIHHHHHHHHR